MESTAVVAMAGGVGPVETGSFSPVSNSTTDARD